MKNDKERERAIAFMFDEKIKAAVERRRSQKNVMIAMRLHESEVDGFIDGLIKMSEQMRIQSN